MMRILNSSQVHPMVLPFEDTATLDEHNFFARRNPQIPVIGIVTYVLIVFAGQRMMRDMKPFDLKGLLFAWNVGLAVFSILSFIRFSAMIVESFRGSHDLQDFMCSNDREADRVSAFWFKLFVYSKFVEFGDTMFLILRKKRIIFLHWYHHITVLLMAWIVFVQKSAVGPFFGGVNVWVHSLMYSYYAAQAIGLRVGKVTAMILTMIQTTQMLVGLVVVYLTHAYSSTERGCRSTHTVTACASIMYASYFLLFARLFVHNYIKRSNNDSLDKNNNHIKSQ